MDSGSPRAPPIPRGCRIRSASPPRHRRPRTRNTRVRRGSCAFGWPEPIPDWVVDDDHLGEGARLLRRYHDLVEGFRPPAGARWRMVAPTAHEIICHNDWAPGNALFRERRLAVMLDWDMAGPGTRLWDVANSAYSWVPLYSGRRQLGIDAQARRLRLFCDAY